MRAGTLIALVTLVTSVLPLAGCVEDEPLDSAKTNGSDPVVITSPTDYSYLDNEAENAELRAHLHDYWNGRARIEVMRETSPAQITWEGTPVPLESFRAPAGSVIPQGTAFVEVAFTWTESPTNLYSDVELWVRTAADRESRRVAALGQGEVVRVPSTNVDNDLPHQSLSAWSFDLVLRAEPRTGFVQYDGEVSIVVEAERGLEIPLFPAHPDRWDGRAEFSALKGGGGGVVVVGNTDGGAGCLGGCIKIHTPADGVVIPGDARLVEVTIEMGEDSPARLGLSFHGGESRAFTKVAPETDEPGRRVFLIPVSGNGDGPYALQSIWEFLPYIEEPAEHGAYPGTYGISARVLK